MAFFCFSLLFQKRQQRPSKQPIALEWLFVLFIGDQEEAKAADQTKTSKKKKKRKRERKKRKKEKREKGKKRKEKKRKEKKKQEKEKKKRKRKRQRKRKKKDKDKEQEKKGEKEKKKGKKRKKGAEKTDKKTSLTGARVHTKAKNKRKLRNAFGAQKWKNLYFLQFQSKSCATHPARTPDSFGMTTCIRCRGPNLGKKQPNKQEKARKRKKKKKRGKKKKRKKGAEKTDKKTSLTGARVHTKAKNKRKLRNAFGAQKQKNLFFPVPKAKVAPHTPRVKPTPLEWQFVSVVGFQNWAKAAEQTRKSNKKKNQEIKKKQKKGKTKKTTKAGKSWCTKQRCPKHRKASGNQARPKIGLNML